ncbi:hypothetical protein FE810_03405 [Thalassotalea litorea]|uniref:DUF4468 domain-containing protein n=1 Tax=Thalassotalea litorea TaxID=2020715 RepID=A0A5R9IPY3_9GAMM|nr:hypothetical protein [Thalassotalea litorea]TLU67342.1 hypothetical protein FE810_03405 [Thalassotalea litorea]
MKKVIIIALSVILSACASIKITPPDQVNVDTQRVFNSSYEQTWIRVVDWFAEHHVTIEKIEKSSGLITAKYLITDTNNFLDCGDIRASGTLGDARINKLGSLNVTVRATHDEKTKVNVNFFGEFKLYANDGWDGRLITAEGICVSSGKLEQNILDFIEN